MKAYRTPWWYFVLGIMFGVLLGSFLVSVTESSTVSLLGAPWIVIIVMLLAGVVTFVMAWQTHQYTTSKPEDRKPFNPQCAVAALMLSKSLGMAGAILTGWYGGEVFMSLPHKDIPLYAEVILECSVVGVICLIDMIIGILGEWLCQLPPEDGAESARKKSNRTAVTC